MGARHEHNRADSGNNSGSRAGGDGADIHGIGIDGIANRERIK